MEIASRPAVRIICLDASSRVLMMMWQDPHDGSRLWEPPGGGIDPGETPIEAARRELTEETGLDPAAIVDRPLVVQRDTIWNGKRFIGPEEFYLARYSGEQPALNLTGLLPDEQQNLRRHAWLNPSELTTLPDRLEPPTLLEIIATLTRPTP
jgi:8-oxo-dGTP pyrophosphatase MutT (NUDIX family)